MKGTGFSPYIQANKMNHEPQPLYEGYGLQPVHSPRQNESLGFSPRGNAHRTATDKRLVSGHEFTRAASRFKRYAGFSPSVKGTSFSPCVNVAGFGPCVKGTGFSPYIHLDKMNPWASAPEGTLIEPPTTTAL